MTEVVWWSESGYALHRDFNCRMLQRAIQRARAAYQRGEPEKAPVIRSYDFSEDTAQVDNYPPDRMALCDLCIGGRAGRSEMAQRLGRGR